MCVLHMCGVCVLAATHINSTTPPPVAHPSPSCVVQLYELHGNTNLERCPKCGAEYMRDFKTRNSTKGVHHHGTGRTCTREGCGTEL